MYAKDTTKNNFEMSSLIFHVYRANWRPTKKHKKTAEENISSSLLFQ